MLLSIASLQIEQQFFSLSDFHHGRFQYILFFVHSKKLPLALTFNACRMKKGLDGFWRPTNQHFIFWPFIPLEKKLIIKSDVFGDSNGRQLV